MDACGFGADYGKRFRGIFGQEHKTLVERFEKRFIKYRDQWIASAAGAEFINRNEAAKSILYILFEFNDVFGRKPFSKLSTVADLLKRIPTPPTTSNHFDHFPINTATLNEWVRHFESDAQSEADLKPTVPESIGSDDFAAIL